MTKIEVEFTLMTYKKPFLQVRLTLAGKPSYRSFDTLDEAWPWIREKAAAALPEEVR